MSSQRIKASLKSSTGKQLEEGVNRVSLGDGYCIHPFTYKGVQYKDGRCYKAKENEYWCATNVDKEEDYKIKTFAYCKK